MRQKQLPFFFFIYLSFSTPLVLLLAALGPACVSVDRDRHMQGGQQPCLASACSPWQKISMRADNRTRNENNAVCQPRNPACHSRTFAILGVFHEHSLTRKLNLKWNSAFAALIPDRPRLQRLWEAYDIRMCVDVHHTDPEKSGSSLASASPTVTSPRGLFFAWLEPFSSQFCQIRGPCVPKTSIISVFQNPFQSTIYQDVPLSSFLTPNLWYMSIKTFLPQYVNSFYLLF